MSITDFALSNHDTIICQYYGLMLTAIENNPLEQDLTIQF